MKSLNSTLHRGLHSQTKKAWTRFSEALEDPTRAQKAVLREILDTNARSDFADFHEFYPEMSLSEFKNRKIFEFSDFEKFIEWQKKGLDPSAVAPGCKRYQPTSGSNQLKWIPYSPLLLKQFDEAAAAWMHDMALEFPGILQGRHYWALSWLPNDLKKAGATTDDLELFPVWKRWLMNRIMAAPASIAGAGNNEAALFATATYLCAARDLSFISLWSPTLLLSLLRLIEDKRSEIERTLTKGSWAVYEQELKRIPCPRNIRAALYIGDVQKLWPRLELISAWGNSSSKPFLNDLQKRFPFVKFQPKGLWSTEAVVTIPFRNRNPVMVTAHYFEFLDLATGNVLALDEVKEGDRVTPIVTTGGGLFRYKTGDILDVTGFSGKTPAMEFANREMGTDLVGEKTSLTGADKILKEIEERFPVQAMTIMAISENRPHYRALLKPLGPVDSAAVEDYLEAALLRSFHYRLARELRQLDSATVVLNPRALEIYEEIGLERGIIQGNIKVDRLIGVHGSIWEKVRNGKNLEGA